VVGDRINNKKVVYYSHLARDKIFSLLKKTKFSIISNENFYSLFCIDCISSGVRVFFDKRTKPNIFFFNKSNYIPIDFNNLNEINVNIKNWSARYNLIDYKVNNKFNLEVKKLNFFINKLSTYF
jgi:hypothetical protein